MIDENEKEGRAILFNQWLDQCPENVAVVERPANEDDVYNSSGKYWISVHVTSDVMLEREE